MFVDINADKLSNLPRYYFNLRCGGFGSWECCTLLCPWVEVKGTFKVLVCQEFSYNNLRYYIALTEILTGCEIYHIIMSISDCGGFGSWKLYVLNMLAKNSGQLIGSNGLDWQQILISVFSLPIQDHIS